MKKMAYVGLLLMSFLVPLPAGASASAQPADELVAEIPFDFYVGGKTMPAGEYTVRTVTAYDDGGLQIRSADGSEGVLILAHAAQARSRRPGPARLVFNRYGDQRFLSVVWRSGGYGRELRPSKRERNLRKELRVAQKSGGPAAPPTGVVTVVARLEKD